MNKKHIVEAIALALILASLFVVWYNLTYREMTAYIENKPYQEFGIETSHDEYIDNRPQGRYTKSGIRILPKGEQ
jgi:hypothetical protein